MSKFIVYENFRHAVCCRQEVASFCAKKEVHTSCICIFPYKKMLQIFVEWEGIYFYADTLWSSKTNKTADVLNRCFNKYCKY